MQTLLESRLLLLIFNSRVSKEMLQLMPKALSTLVSAFLTSLAVLSSTIEQQEQMRHTEMGFSYFLHTKNLQIG